MKGARLVAALGAVTLLAACGAPARPAGRASPQGGAITVYAASSLTSVLPRIDPRPRYSFGASSTLAAQITQGAPADVFASANTSIPDQLFAQRLVRKPVVFTSNRLVLVVPASNPAGIHTVYDLKKPGTKLVIAASEVPVGNYTLQVLARLRLSASVLANVVSREADVRSVLSKVALGEADAGFVYATDAKTVPHKVQVLKVSARVQPTVAYAIAIVSSSSHQQAAQRYIDEILSTTGQSALHAAGFAPTPRKKTAP